MPEGPDIERRPCSVALQLPPEARPEVALHQQLPEPDRGLVYDVALTVPVRA
jgi:hypothetical protein